MKVINKRSRGFFKRASTMDMLYKVIWKKAELKEIDKQRKKTLQSISVKCALDLRLIKIYWTDGNVNISLQKGVIVWCTNNPLFEHIPLSFKLTKRPETFRMHSKCIKEHHCLIHKVQDRTVYVHYNNHKNLGGVTHVTNCYGLVSIDTKL